MKRVPSATATVTTVHTLTGIAGGGSSGSMHSFNGTSTAAAATSSLSYSPHHHHHHSASVEVTMAITDPPLSSSSSIDSSYAVKAILRLRDMKSDVRVLVSCNDCEKRSKSPFHFLGMECAHCQGYNTVRV